MADEQTTEQQVLPHAKDISKIFKFVAPAFVVICAVLKWLSVFASASMAEILEVGAFIYAVGAGTIDLNLIFDKFVKKGKED